MAARKKPGVADVMRHGFKPARRRRAAAAGRGPAPKGRPKGGGTHVNGAAPASTGAGPAMLEKQRAELSRQFAELQWDLGGIAYEMASRDHYRLDVLNKQAARLQQVDAELGQIEHLLKLDQAGAAGTCPSCGALQARGAVFCWQCGNEVKPPTDAAKATAAKKPASSETTER
jgi:hypothetical protein